MNPTALSDTIVAIATAIVPAQGSVGIVRLSGSQALAIATTLFHPARSGDWQSHQMRYGQIRTETGSLLDEALVVWMQAPRSYTCEDVVEFHCHGGLMLVQGVVQACLRQGARQADPGEFTLRAFLNGRIDLTQAESVWELIAARSPEAATLALSGLQGKLADPIRAWRTQSLELLAEVEARIDFEEDLPPLDTAAWVQQLEQMRHDIQTLMQTAPKGEVLRQGLKVAIVGRPNVGKSSLLNRWSGQDRAIVTELPGTTRDVVESHLVVRGIPILLLDTAGIRDTPDQVEQLGVERSRRLAQEADLVILVVDASQGWTPADHSIFEQIQHRPLVIVLNKSDLLDASFLDPSHQTGSPVWDSFPAPPLPFSAHTGSGLIELEARLERLAYQGQVTTTTDAGMAINQRQLAALIRVEAALEQVSAAVKQALPLDFWTIDLRNALQLLGEITGEEVTESVLDRIFSRFCIGK